MIRRHPFPGPGLAIRVPGEITREKLDGSSGWPTRSTWTRSTRPASNDQIWQAFAVLLAGEGPSA